MIEVKIIIKGNKTKFGGKKINPLQNKNLQKSVKKFLY